MIMILFYDGCDCVDQLLSRRVRNTMMMMMNYVLWCDCDSFDFDDELLCRMMMMKDNDDDDDDDICMCS